MFLVRRALDPPPRRVFPQQPMRDFKPGLIGRASFVPDSKTISMALLVARSKLGEALSKVERAAGQGRGKKMFLRKHLLGRCQSVSALRRGKRKKRSASPLCRRRDRAR